MTSAAPGLAALALAAAAAIGLYATHAHYAARDTVRAITLANTHRFAGTTASRLDIWLDAHRGGSEVRWAAEPPGPLDREVRVILHLDGAPHAFDVDPGARIVRPADDAAAALIRAVHAEGK